MININHILFFQMGAFLALLFILNIILYKPLLRKIRERNETIDSLIKAAKQYQEEAENNKTKYEERLKEAEKKAKQSYNLKISETLKEREERISEESKKVVEEIVKFEEELNKSIEKELASSRDYSIELANKIYRQLIG